MTRTEVAEFWDLFRRGALKEAAIVCSEAKWASLNLWCKASEIVLQTGTVNSTVRISTPMAFGRG